MIALRHHSFQRIVIGIIMAILALILVGEIIWEFWIAPRLVIRRISLESDLGLSDEQLLEMLNLENQTWTSLDEEELRSRLEAYPVIREAKVVKVFPDELRLSVSRRLPLAIALVETEEGPVPAVFDEEGYAVQVGTKPGIDNLPIISGPRFPEPALGARLPDSLHGILANLSELREKDPRLFALLSEVEIVPHAGEGYDLRLYMNHAPIPVLVDSSLGVEDARRAVLVIDILSSASVGLVAEADMRGGHVVYRRAEEI